MTDAADRRRAELIARESARPGRQGRINAKCIECIYDPESGDGNWRQQITACTAPDCPLYPIRPIPALSQKKANRSRRHRDIHVLAAIPAHTPTMRSAT